MCDVDDTGCRVRPTDPADMTERQMRSRSTRVRPALALGLAAAAALTGVLLAALAPSVSV
ncbi:MAG: hypothetical protein JWM45_3586, partial [Pseudonocardiales bacterium]|nr:hypothetical protein [Pseudonocardiales bacterium]